MNEQELNKRLAEWAGWHWEKYQVAIDGMRGMVLLAPNEELVKGYIGYIPDHTPNFTQSLDACEPLIVKLDVCDLSIEEGIFATAKVAKLGLGKASAVEEIRDNKPIRAFATALSRAIDKLIDKEG